MLGEKRSGFKMPVALCSFPVGRKQTVVAFSGYVNAHITGFNIAFKDDIYLGLGHVLKF